MNFRSSNRKYLLLFFFLGQSPFCPQNSATAPKSKRATWILNFIQCIPSIAYSIFLLVTISFYLYVTVDDSLTISSSLYTVFIWNKMAAAIIVLKGSPLISNSFAKIWSAFESLEQFSIQSLHYQWSHKRYEKHLLTKFCIIMVLNTVRMVSKHTFHPVEHTLFKAFLVYSMIFIAFTIALHILLYLEIMNHAMNTVNKHLSKRLRFRQDFVFNLQENYQKPLLADIEIYKCIHYKLYKLCKLINRNFGWIFECYFMQVFGNMLNLFTVIIIDFHTENLTNGFHIVSMYFLHYISFMYSG